jgi:diamine N-acetyltransferase
MACSDLTPSMMGPPTFPEIPIPTWDDFTDDYVEYFFDGSRENLGRSYIIEADGGAVGHISHSQTDVARGLTELDIWLRSSRDCGKGFGSAALRVLAQHLHATLGLHDFIIRPSRRNLRAVRVYAKAGFIESALTTEERAHLGPHEAHDTVVMRLSFSHVEAAPAG